MANRRKDALLATLAHALRSPLVPIRRAAEVLRMLAHLDPTRQNAVGIIDPQVSPMVRHVDNLLDVHRISRGDMLLHAERVDVARAVRAAEDTSRPLLEAGEHHGLMSLPRAPITVTGDAAMSSRCPPGCSTMGRASSALVSPWSGASCSCTGARCARILIADDHVDFAESEATMLALTQHIVCVAHDARAALDEVPVFAPDVALLDIGLPGMDGYELAARLRTDPANADLVLIAQTGWGQPADRERALALGGRAHLTKPVDWATLERGLVRA